MISIRRTGATLAAVLICLAIIMLFASAVVRAMTTRHRASRLDQQQLQCLWLLESAGARATARLRAEPTFVGDEWRVSFDDGRGAQTGVARCTIESLPSETMKKRLRIEASWPDDPIYRVTRTTEFFLTLQLPPGAAR